MGDSEAGQDLYDSDLENEMGQRDHSENLKRASAKYGMDFDVREDENGGLFEK